jgi:riboflavin kinase / FMN adenylyltransferase
MQIYYGTTDFRPLSYAIVTSGTFDGVHFGHQRILQRTRALAQAHKAQNAESVLLTYHPHPRLVLFPAQKDLKLLTTLDEKIDLAAKFGIEHFLIIPFDKKFSDQSSKEFIENILVTTINTKKLVIGYDHKFGKNREGSFEYLKANEKEFGFEVEEIPAQEIDEIAVSSTKIRKALEEGNIKLANHYLQYDYYLSGLVVKGNQIGRTIGFPTANLQVAEPQKLIPAEGIYAVFVHHNKLIYKGMLYIGRRTTLGEDLERTVEVNIFDFDQDIYGQQLRLQFVKKLRGEEKFESLAAMQAQLAADKIETLLALQK